MMAVGQDHNAGLAFLRAAALRPQATAIFNDSFHMTYGQLAELSLSLARGLQLRGVGRSATVAVRTEDVVALLATVYATALLGARWVFTRGHVDLLHRAGVTVLLDAGVEGEPLLPGAVRLDGSLLAPPETGNEATRFPGYDDPDAPWMLSETSGTTGFPKLVVMSHRVTSRRLTGYEPQFPREGTRITGLMQTGAIAMTMRYMSALLRGGVIMADPDPQAWWRHRVDVVFGAPNQLDQFIGDTVLPGRLPVVHTAGAAVPDRLLAHLLQSFEQVSVDYGSTECGLCFSVLHGRGEDGSIVARTEFADGVAVDVVDAEDRLVPPGDEGSLRIGGETLALGYLDDPDLTARVFRGGWFLSGDLACRGTDGVLRITGRANDLFNLGGMKINAIVLDTAILRVKGVRDAATFLVPVDGEEDRLTAFVELEPGALATDVFALIRVELMRLGSPRLVPRRLLRTDRVPRTPSGKPDRAACTAAILGARAARSRTADAGEP
jgi:acyl-coenzyme A synthetase/AMP-(fatty) acid ligase